MGERYYKGYTIKKVTRIDWVIYFNGESCDALNFDWKRPGSFNARTLKDAKARIDKAIEG